MYDQPDDDKLNADAEREAEFWRTHERNDAMTDEELDDQIIDWYQSETARLQARGRQLLRFTARLSLALAAVAIFMYVTTQIGSIR